MPADKKAPRELENGRLYFNYAVGAVYEIYPEHGESFICKILDCDYRTETEYYRLETTGNELARELTASELEFLLSWFPYEELDAGELYELPLLNDEVLKYYSDARKELNKQNAEVNAKLKETTYFRNKSALESLRRPIELAQVNGRKDEYAELSVKRQNLEAEQTAILAGLKIDETVLNKKAGCEKCNDSGLISGTICECAYARVEQIKQYNAIQRLISRKK